jgi:phosphoribosylformimino-5-aminoimidazole carboxamide ribonucleotide (ProFAR) isomerase
MVINATTELGRTIVVKDAHTGEVITNAWEVDTDNGRMDLFKMAPDPAQKRCIYARVLNNGRLEQLPVMERVWRDFDVLDSKTGAVLYQARKP